MPRKMKLSDLQLVVLAHAAKRDDGHVLPLPALIADDERTAAEVTALLGRKLIAETPSMAASQQWRSDGGDRIGLVLTDAGRAAIGVDDADTDGAGTAPGSEGAADVDPAAGANALRGPSKRSAVIALLSSPGGATLAEVCQQTGWLQHSARAFLTGLRKRGHAIARERTDGVTRYAMVEHADAQG